MAYNKHKNIKVGTKKAHDTRNYYRNPMPKNMIIEKLKENRCRITKQRILIIDIILEYECICCKDIYNKVLEMDKGVGIATVYRLVYELEQIGVLNRKDFHKVAYFKNKVMENICKVVLDDNTTYNLSTEKWNDIVRTGLINCGYLKDQSIVSIIIK